MNMKRNEWEVVWKPSHTRVADSLQQKQVGPTILKYLSKHTSEIGGAIWRWVWDDPHFTKCTKCDCVLYVMANSRAGILRKAFWYRSFSLYLYLLMALWGCILNYTCNCIVVVQCMVTDHRLRASPALWCSSLWWTTSWSQNQCCRCTQILTPSIMQDQTGAWTIDTRRPCNDIFVLQRHK